MRGGSCWTTELVPRFELQLQCAGRLRHGSGHGPRGASASIATHHLCDTCVSSPAARRPPVRRLLKLARRLLLRSPRSSLNATIPSI